MRSLVTYVRPMNLASSRSRSCQLSSGFNCNGRSLKTRSITTEIVMWEILEWFQTATTCEKCARRS